MVELVEGPLPASATSTTNVCSMWYAKAPWVPAFRGTASVSRGNGEVVESRETLKLVAQGLAQVL